MEDLDFAMQELLVRDAHPVAARIDAALVARSKAERPRAYLGASVCGEKCSRALWYSYHTDAREEFEPFILRRFETGHIMERRVVKYLRLAGFEVVDFDSRGEQYRCSAFEGRFQGHVDGFVKGEGLGDGRTWWLLEAKAMVQAKYVRDADGNPTRNKTEGKTDGRWFEVRKKGVKKAELSHYCQMQAYMGLSRFAPAMGVWPAVVDRALYVAVGTDTEHLYIEEVAYNEDHFYRIMDRAQRVIESPEPPERISENPAWWDCRFCTHRDTCHGAER